MSGKGGPPPRGKVGGNPIITVQKRVWQEEEAEKRAAREADKAAREVEYETQAQWVEFGHVRVRSDQPDNAWALLENTSPSLEVKPATNCVTEEDPVPGGHFRVVVISDTHGLHADIPHVPDGEVKRTSLTPRKICRLLTRHHSCLTSL